MACFQPTRRRNAPVGGPAWTAPLAKSFPTQDGGSDSLGTAPERGSRHKAAQTMPQAVSTGACRHMTAGLDRSHYLSERCLPPRGVKSLARNANENFSPQRGEFDSPSAISTRDFRHQEAGTAPEKVLTRTFYRKTADSARLASPQREVLATGRHKKLGEEYRRKPPAIRW